MIHDRTSLTELAGIVSSALQRHGIDAVLTGGGAVVIWTGQEGQSFDLDFVSPASDKKLRAVMGELGFDKRGKDYIHPGTKFFVEFPSGPLAVGQALANEGDSVTFKVGRRSIRVVSPTFCVMDRLAQYFHWNDRSALDQAVAVAEKHPVNFARIQSWATAEGMTGKLETFRRRLPKLA